MKPAAPPGWEAGTYEGARWALIDDALSVSPAERLAMLEAMIQFAWEAGALALDGGSVRPSVSSAKPDEP